LKRTALLVVVVAGALMIASTADFPSWGDANSPASLNVSRRYIEKALEETATPNIVTAVLADYRGFDTLLETVVVFTAALACFLILRRPPIECVPERYHYRHISTGLVIRKRNKAHLPEKEADFERIDSDWTPSDIVVVTICRIIIPFLQIYALYVLAHGHYSPGGGFQGGVIFAASYVLLAISENLRTMLARLTERAMHLLVVSGVMIYFGVGLLALNTGASFMDYGGLSGILGMSLASGHSLGILLVETGVAITVTTALVTIYSLLSSNGTVTEGL